MVGQLLDEAFHVRLRKLTSGQASVRRRDQSRFSFGVRIDAQKVGQRQNDHPNEEINLVWFGG